MQFFQCITKTFFTKRTNISLAALVLFAAFAPGCPVYPDDNSGYLPQCTSSVDCPLNYACVSGACVLGPGVVGRSDAGVLDAPAAGDARVSDDASDARSSGEGTAAAYCGNPNDCKAGETCSSDGTCHAGDCSTEPCINQFQCAAVMGAPACVHADSLACGADHQCAKSARCVDGRCTDLADLCTDKSQCAPSDECVDGKCVAACTTDSQCPKGYLCRVALGICDASAKPCTVTGDCASKDLVCVDGACVARCGVVGACSDGGASVCVDNGCVPSQKPHAMCQADGSTAGCAAGQICVHHACYTSCAAPNAAACTSLAATPLCRMVTAGATTYAICGTTTTLGSECDPTADKFCAVGKTCIDGFCR